MAAQSSRDAVSRACDPSGRLKGPFLQWIEQGTSGSFEPFKMLLRAARCSALLHYFSDRRHTALDRPIAKDGSNIQHLPLLKEMFDWYKRWMGVLHERKLVGIKKRYKEKLLHLWDTNFQALERFSPKMDEWRLQELGELDEKLYAAKDEDLAVVYEHRPELAWVWQWRQSILNTLFEMQEAAERFPPSHPDAEAAVRRAFTNIPPATWLLVRLIDAEERFEEELQHWHVEDEHMIKRVFIFDDKNFSRLLPCHLAEDLWNFYRPTVIGWLRGISAKARRNFDYRLLRDWGCGRAWKQMDLVVGTGGKDKEELKETVRAVRDVFASGGKLSSDLFGIHPIDLDDVKDSNISRCPVCWGDWEDGDIRMTTHCNHVFHPACVVPHWDQPARAVFACPVCRDPGHLLLDRIEIEEGNIRNPNDKDPHRFTEDELEWLKEDVEWATTWESDPNREFEDTGIRSGNYAEMPDELWQAWALHMRREMVDKELEADPKNISNTAVDPAADWPKPPAPAPGPGSANDDGLDDVS